MRNRECFFEKATKAAAKAEAKKQKQLEALGVKKMAASPIQRNATAVPQRASTGDSPTKGAVAKEEVTASHKSSGLREKSRPASDDNKSSEASFIARAKAKRAARNRRLRPPYTVKLADSCQVVHFNKGMNEDDDLDSRMWTVDQPDQVNFCNIVVIFVHQNPYIHAHIYYFTYARF